MGGGGSKTQTQTTVQKNEPWAPAQPYLSEILSKTGSLYNSGVGQQYYPGQTVADYSPDTLDAINAMEARARAGTPFLSDAEGLLSGVLGGDYLEANPAFGFLGSVASGAEKSNNPAIALLQRQANGDFLNNNPYRDEAFGAASKKIQGGVDSAMSRAGRGLNTGAYQGMLTDQLGDLGKQFYFDDYARERGLMDSAASRIGDLYGQGEQNQINAGNILGGLYAGERNNQMNALQLAPTIQGMGYTDADRLLQSGQLLDAKNQEKINADMTKFMFNQQAPWAALSDYSNIVNTLGSNYGTQTGTTTGPAPSQNKGMQYGGMALSALGMMAM